MWSAARYHLHLTASEFYALTPRQFDALMRRYRYETESGELLFGQLTSWVANTGFRTAEKQTSAADFMPSQWRKAPVINGPVEMTQERRNEIANGLRECLMPLATIKKREGEGERPPGVS
jgi:hypothetical protein